MDFIKNLLLSMVVIYGLFSSNDLLASGGDRVRTESEMYYDHAVAVEIPSDTVISKKEHVGVSEERFSLPIKDPVIIFSLVLCVMLILPLIFAKMHIPGILGIIIAGVILGPNGFNVLAKDSSVVLFGTVGIVYLMFFSGLEVDFNDFKKSSLKSFIFGVLTFVLPQTLGTLGNMWILKMDLQSALLLASTYASHTLLTYPLVSKLGVKKNEAVVIAIGGTIITNTASLTVLALTTVGEINGEILLKIAGNFIILCIIAWVAVPIIARLFFKYMDGDGVQHFLFVLGTVFTVATLSQLLGIEPVIGAFLAGLGLNRFITEGSVLINRLEFTGNALFIPYFLLYVGMLVDPRSFTQSGKTWAFAAVMTV
ncbi:MAG: cation:proton antiporter, partial [Lentisphaeria bacterium]